MKKLICPQCKSPDIISHGASIEFISHSYKCNNCLYEGQAIEIERKSVKKNKKEFIILKR
ncbi:MAG: hypothetical protein AABW75_01590 [Nanoarchaeota archaeon]